jgi:hypothetical protein
VLQRLAQDWVEKVVHIGSGEIFDAETLTDTVVEGGFLAE